MLKGPSDQKGHEGDGRCVTRPEILGLTLTFHPAAEEATLVAPLVKAPSSQQLTNPC